MANLFTLTGTAAQGQLLKDALCANFEYQPQVRNEKGETVDNPETDAQFAKRMINNFCIGQIRSYRLNQFEKGRNDILSSAKTESEGLDVQ